MEHIQYTFQATFEERIDHLAEYEVEDLRVMFTYFDSDRDGAVTADQVTRMFKMLGLEVNGAQVKELGHVFFPEFLKIVDSNMVVPSTSKKSSDHECNSSTTTGINTMLPNGKVNIIAQEKEAKLAALAVAQQHAEERIQEEWKLIDSFQRGSITLQELKDFVRNCNLQIPHRDLVRFMEIYGESTDIEEYTMILTKTGFEKFRRQYDTRSFDRDSHFNGFSSDEDQEDPNDEEEEDNYIQTAGAAAAAKALSKLPIQFANIKAAVAALQQSDQNQTAPNDR